MTVEQELIGLEKTYWQALKDHDVETAKSLTAFPCMVAGPEGVAEFDEKQFVSMMQSPMYSIVDYELKDIKVRRLGDVAIVGYNVHQNLDLNGERLTFDGADTSTWVHRNGRWICAQHSETPLGDPFGRPTSELGVTDIE